MSIIVQVEEKFRSPCPTDIDNNSVPSHRCNKHSLHNTLPQSRFDRADAERFKGAVFYSVHSAWSCRTDYSIWKPRFLEEPLEYPRVFGVQYTFSGMRIKL